MLFEITTKEFNTLRSIMYSRTGVFLKDTKKTLVSSRLKNRLEQLKLKDFKSYIPLIDNRESEELELFINALTTNETHFFRHVKQFNYLYENIFPLLKMKRNLQTDVVKIWSAACATGEEPYSIAIACKEFFHNLGIKIFATDINSRVLETARKGIFPERSLKAVPQTLIKKYFMTENSDNKHTGKYFQLSDEIRDSVIYFQHNLLDPFPKKDIDIIFFRNVLIYFNTESKQKVIRNLETNLAQEGYLFISLSESLYDVNTSLKSVYSGIFQKPSVF